jgi:hypothetical protein
MPEVARIIFEVRRRWNRLRRGGHGEPHIIGWLCLSRDGLLARPVTEWPRQDTRGSAAHSKQVHLGEFNMRFLTAARVLISYSVFAP